MRALLPGLLAAGAILATAAMAQNAVGDANAGHRFASASCSGCHLVDEQQTKPAVDGVPTYQSLANDPTKTPDRLRTFLASPHGAMPPLSLSRQEIEDVVAYIGSLKK
jgi:mono/diheme cytochrome c family protein